MRKLGVVAFTVTGIVLIGQALLALGNIGYSLSPGMWDAFSISSLALYVASVIGVATLGGWLISARESLASRWLDDTELNVSVTAKELLQVGLVLIGIPMLVRGVAGLLSAASTWLNALASASGSGAQDLFGESIWSTMGIYGVSSLLTIVVAVMLIVRAEPLARRLAPAASPTPDFTAEPDHHPLCPSCGTPFEPGEYRDNNLATCPECGSPLYERGV